MAVRKNIKKTVKQKLNEGGLFVGPSHAEDGIKFRIESTGELVEVEGEGKGEPNEHKRGEGLVCNNAMSDPEKKVYRGKPHEILSEINTEHGCNSMNEKAEKIIGGESVINRRSMSMESEFECEGTPDGVASAINHLDGRGVKFSSRGKCKLIKKAAQDEKLAKDGVIVAEKGKLANGGTTDFENLPTIRFEDKYYGKKAWEVINRTFPGEKHRIRLNSYVLIDEADKDIINFQFVVTDHYEFRLPNKKLFEDKIGRRINVVFYFTAPFKKSANSINVYANGEFVNTYHFSDFNLKNGGRVNNFSAEFKKVPGKLPIFAVIAENSNKLSRIFVRIGEHYDGDGFKDKIFTLDEFKNHWTHNGKKEFDYYDYWFGFNVPDHSIKSFVDGSFDPLSPEEKWLVDNIKSNVDFSKPYYIIGYAKGNDAVRRHELAHALYYLSPKYKKAVDAIIDSIPKSELKTLTEFLQARHYHKSVYKDEMQAYLLADKKFLQEQSGWNDSYEKYRKKLNDIFDHSGIPSVKKLDKMENGGKTDDFASSNKIHTFTNKSTKNEIRDVISGASEVTSGAAIQAAASYLRRSQSPSQVAGGIQHGFNKKAELEELTKFIDQNNLWVDVDLSQYTSSGFEQQVYLKDEKSVFKLNNAIFYDSWLDYFNNLLLHNYFFPTTAYSLVGFYKLDYLILPVIQQPFIKATQKTDLNDVKKFMSDNGFTNTKRNDYENTQLGIILEDLHDNNVLTRNGLLYFIDTVFYLKDQYKKLGSGGKTDDFASSNKIHTFTNKSTKNEIRNIISGASEVTSGATIQAALVHIRGNEGANPTSSKTKSEIEREKLTEFIDKNNLWYTETLDKSNHVGNGVEQLVFKDPNSSNFVVKTNNFIFYNSWNEYLINLLLHNYFFPRTAYELIGFQRNSRGNIFPVVKQPFIEKNKDTDLKDVEKFLLDNDFIRVDPSFNVYENKELGITIGDLHDGNVLTKTDDTGEDVLYFIDTKFFISLNDDYVLNNGGKTDDFSHSDKNRIFIPNKITKDELQSIISGTGKVANGDLIQAALLYIRGKESPSSSSKGAKPEREKERTTEYADGVKTDSLVGKTISLSYILDHKYKKRGIEPDVLIDKETEKAVHLKKEQDPKVKTRDTKIDKWYPKSWLKTSKSSGNLYLEIPFWASEDGNKYVGGGIIPLEETIDDTNYRFIKDIKDLKIDGTRYFLEEIINHDKLFEKYPEFRKIIVIFKDITDNELTADSSLTIQENKISEIKIGLHFSYYKKHNHEKFELRKTHRPEFSKEAALLHEINHAVQYKNREFAGYGYDEILRSELRQNNCASEADARRRGIWERVEQEAEYFYFKQPSEQESLWAVDTWLKKIGLNYGDRRFLFYDESPIFEHIQKNKLYSAGGILKNAELNNKGGYDYSGKDKKIADRCGLVTLPKDIPGTNCSNCIFFKNNFCDHKEVLLPVTSKQCCSFWDDKSLISIITNLPKANFFPDKTKSTAKLNDLGGYDYSGKELERARKADLITLPKDIKGTNCAATNCIFGGNICTHPKIKLPVTDRQSCGWWNNEDVIRPWGKAVENKFLQGGPVKGNIKEQKSNEMQEANGQYEIKIKTRKKEYILPVEDITAEKAIKTVKYKYPTFKEFEYKGITYKKTGMKGEFLKKIEPPEVIEARWKKKKERIHTIANDIQKLRNNVSRDLKSDDEKTFLTALIISIIDRTAERIGNSTSEDDGHFGVTGFKKSHATIIGNKILFCYTGKSGVDHEKAFSDERICKALRKAIKNSPSKFIFTTSDGLRIRSNHVNDYLREFGVSAKDLRGYASNNWMIQGLKKIDPIESSDKKRKRQFNIVLKNVAAKVGHGPSTLKTHYLMPELIDEFINNGKILDIKEYRYQDGGVIATESEIKKIYDYYKKNGLSASSSGLYDDGRVFHNEPLILLIARVKEGILDSKSLSEIVDEIKSKSLFEDLPKIELESEEDKIIKKLEQSKAESGETLYARVGTEKQAREKVNMILDLGRQATVKQEQNGSWAVYMLKDGGKIPDTSVLRKIYGYYNAAGDGVITYEQADEILSLERQGKISQDLANVIGQHALKPYDEVLKEIKKHVAEKSLFDELPEVDLGIEETLIYECNSILKNILKEYKKKLQPTAIEALKNEVDYIDWLLSEKSKHVDKVAKVSAIKHIRIIFNNLISFDYISATDKRKLRNKINEMEKFLNGNYDLPKDTDKELAKTFFTKKEALKHSNELITKGIKNSITEWNNTWVVNSFYNDGGKTDSARTIAVGELSGGKVKQAEDNGWEFISGELVEGSDEYWDLVGAVGGAKAKQLLGKGITIRKKPVEKKHGGKISELDLHKSKNKIAISELEIR